MSAAPERTLLSRRPSWMTDELQNLAEVTRAFFAKEVEPHQQRFARQGHPDRELYRRVGEIGLACMSIPESYGGGGGTFAHDAVLFTEQVKGGDSALHLGVHAAIVPHYINAYGSEEQKGDWLPRLARGDLVGAIAMTEPGTGSDLQRIATRAVRDGDDYVVTGSKTFISNGHLCDLVIIAVKTGPGQGAAGVSLLVAEIGDTTPGFTRGRIIDKIGQKGQDTAELFFDGMRVPSANLLGGVEGRGFAQLMRQLVMERLICAVAAVAAMERAVELTVAYTRERQVFGKPLFDQQNTRFELAECASVTAVGRTFLDDCIERHLRGEVDATTAAVAKYWLTEQQCAVVDRCLQLFGGYGYTTEYAIGRMYVDARVQRIYAGANELMKELIARAL